MIKLKSQSGWTTFEAGVAFMVLLPFVMAGIALVDFAGASNSVSGIVEKFLYDSDVAALSRGANGQVTINDSEIESFIEQVSAQAETELKDRIVEVGSTANYLIEVKAVSLAINPQSGLVVGSPNPEFSKTLGSLTPSSDANSATDLEAAFQRKASETIALADSSVISRLAVPTVGFGRPGSDSYLPIAVMIGMRLVVDLNDTFSGQMYALAGGDSEAYSAQVIMLRGELK